MTFQVRETVLPGQFVRSVVWEHELRDPRGMRIAGCILFQDRFQDEAEFLGTRESRKMVYNMLWDLGYSITPQGDGRFTVAWK